MAIINNDEQTEFIQGFKEYIDKNAELVEVENNEQKIQDALFYRDVNYILIIPQNYTQDFLNGEKTEIEIRKTQDSYATYMEMLINRYLKMAEIYNNTGMNQSEMNEAIKKDIENEINITISNETKEVSINKPLLYYNFANYSFLAIAIYLIATVMSVFNNEMIKKKNNISKTPYRKISNQLLLGNIIFIIVLWAVYVAISFILYKDIMLTNGGLLLMLSSLVFIITAAAFGFLISSLIKNKNAISGVVNVVALGLSFISGCFVPQQWISETVLSFAKLFPSYWYIKTNENIANLTEYSMNELQPIFNNMLIILGFGVFYIIILKVIQAIKRKKTTHKD